MKIKRKGVVEKLLIIASICLVMILWTSKLYFSNLIAIMVMIINIYSLIKARKNVFIFFLFLAFTYFDYSVIFSKYLFRIENFNWIFQYIKYDDTLFIGISLVYIFHALILLLVNSRLYESKEDIFDISESEKLQNYGKIKMVIIILSIMVCIVLFDYLFFHKVFVKETIYEYLLIPIVIIVYYSRNDKIFNKLALIIILISAAINIYKGERIASLSPLIAYFFINYYKRINFKKIIYIVFIGVIAYTFFGLYGDILSHNGDTTKLRLVDLKEKVIDDKLTLDTAYSAYWTGLTYVEMSKRVDTKTRFNNFVKYMTAYTFIGEKSKYIQLSLLTRKYYLHWYGGYITSYFYFWLGLLGIPLISVYITVLLNRFANIVRNSNNYIKILFVYFISTVPRWYLYFPTSLIRGIILYTIIYYIIYIFISKETKKINNK